VAREPQQDALERIWRVVASIPAGRVESYGSVARRAGLPGRARLVGHALKVAPKALRLPWHRVVNASGRISFPEGSPSHALQRSRLAREGVRFCGATVASEARGEATDLDQLLWGPPSTGDRR
jgi:methylated-DNA-protein-cysteine methyltransferase-like protein